MQRVRAKSKGMGCPQRRDMRDPGCGSAKERCLWEGTVLKVCQGGSTEVSHSPRGAETTGYTNIQQEQCKPAWPCLTAKGWTVSPPEIPCNPVPLTVLYGRAPKGNLPHCPSFSLICSGLVHQLFPPADWFGMCSCKWKGWCLPGVCAYTLRSITQFLWK